MRINDVKQKKATFAGGFGKSSSDGREVTTFLKGLERFVNAGDSSEDYSHLAIAARSFWPYKRIMYRRREWIGPTHRMGSGWPLVVQGIQDYLRRVWGG